MELPLVLGAVALVSSIGVLWWAVAGPRQRPAGIELGNYALPRPDLEAAARRADDDTSVLVGGLAGLGRRLTPSGWVTSLERRVLAAGSPKGWAADRLLAFKGLVGVVTALLVALRAVSSPSAGGLFLTVAAGALAYFLPDARLTSMIQEREDKVRVDLAETVDQITIMVQAGLALDGAIARTARTSSGPLAAELTRVSHDVRAGIPRSQALLAMAERVALPELRQVVSALAQAEQLGVPIAQTLQIQAGEMREKRRQYAEEKAMKLPVKVLFPTVVCILPSLFVVVLGPAVMNIMDTFGS